jgi:hypothetical protein
MKRNPWRKLLEVGLVTWNQRLGFGYRFCGFTVQFHRAAPSSCEKHELPSFFGGKVLSRGSAKTWRVKTEPILLLEFVFLPASAPLRELLFLGRTGRVVGQGRNIFF